MIEDPITKIRKTFKELGDEQAYELFMEVMDELLFRDNLFASQEKKFVSLKGNHFTVGICQVSQHKVIGSLEIMKINDKDYYSFEITTSSYDFVYFGKDKYFPPQSEVNEPKKCENTKDPMWGIF